MEVNGNFKFVILEKQLIINNYFQNFYLRNVGDKYIL